MSADAPHPDRFDGPHDADAPAGGFAPLAVLSRRWPLMLLGLAAGALVGVLVHLTSTRMYQSMAMLLVVQKRPVTESTSGGGGVGDGGRGRLRRGAADDHPE